MLELVGHGQHRRAGLLGQAGQPVVLLVAEGQGAIGLGLGVQPEGHARDHVEEVVVRHVVEQSDHLRRIARAHKGIEQLPAGGRLDPAGAEVGQRRDFLDQGRGHAAFEVLNGDHAQAAIDHGADEAAQVVDDGSEALDPDGGLGGCRRVRHRRRARAVRLWRVW